MFAHLVHYKIIRASRCSNHYGYSIILLLILLFLERNNWISSGQIIWREENTMNGDRWFSCSTWWIIALLWENDMYRVTQKKLATLLTRHKYLYVFSCADRKFVVSNTTLFEKNTQNKGYSIQFANQNN